MKNNFKISNEKIKKLGEFLKEIRDKKGYTMSQVEMYTGLSKKEVSFLETGQKQKPNPFYLKTLAKYYKINVQELYKIIGYIDEEKIEYNLSNLKTLDELKKSLSTFLASDQIPEKEKKEFLEFVNEIYYLNKTLKK